MKKTPREIAKYFLEYYLESFDGDIKAVCSDHRMVGGSGYDGFDVSIGNMFTTTPEKPGKTITLTRSKTEKFKFTVKEIYSELNPLKASKIIW